MPPRSRQTLAAAALVLGLVAWRAWRSDSATPALASGPKPSAAPSANIPAAPAPPDEKPAVVATPPPPESPAARFRREVAAMSAEFEALRALPDDIENLRASAELENEYAALLEERPDLAAMLVREMPAGFADTHFGTLALLRWAASERGSAAAWMAGHPAATAPAAQALARGWLAEDETALAAHLASLPPGPWRSNLAFTASEDAFLARRPATVIALLEQAAPNDPRHAQLLEWNTTAWAIQDPAAAETWARREPDAARRETLLAAVLIGQANQTPALAARRLLETVNAPDARARAAEAIARIWTLSDPEAASAWANSLPETKLRETAEQNLLDVTSSRSLSEAPDSNAAEGNRPD